MIILQNHLGKITISEKYLNDLIAETVTSCFGVVSMNVAGVTDTIKALLPHKRHTGGVKARVGKDKLIIDLHISLMYGVNINAVVKAIVHKVSYTVEQSTNVCVEKVNVFVDDIRC